MSRPTIGRDLVGQKVWSDAARRYVLRYPAPVAAEMGHPELAVQS